MLACFSVFLLYIHYIHYITPYDLKPMLKSTSERPNWNGSKPSDFLAFWETLHYSGRLAFASSVNNQVCLRQMDFILEMLMTVDHLCTLATLFWKVLVACDADRLRQKMPTIAWIRLRLCTAVRLLLERAARTGGGTLPWTSRSLPALRLTTPPIMEIGA